MCVCPSISSHFSYHSYTLCFLCFDVCLLLLYKIILIILLFFLSPPPSPLPPLLPPPPPSSPPPPPPPHLPLPPPPSSSVSVTVHTTVDTTVTLTSQQPLTQKTSEEYLIPVETSFRGCTYKDTNCFEGEVKGAGILHWTPLVIKIRNKPRCTAIIPSAGSGLIISKWIVINCNNNE